MGKITKKYKKYKQDRLNGIYHGAPLFKAFPRFGKLFPILPRAKQICILGGAGSGKSNFWIGFILFPIYELIKNEGYKAKFHIYLLEDDLEFLEDRLMSGVLYRYFDIETDTLSLSSMREEVLSDEIEAALPGAEEIVKDILSYCRVNDGITDATGIYKDARTESTKLGEHFWENREFSYPNSDGTTYSKTVKVYDRYEPEDPKLHNIMIIDNLNNLGPEKGGTRQEAIGMMCREYARLQICKHFGWTVIPIQQTALESDKKQFDMMKGQQIIEKVEPSTDSLGNNKEVIRDFHALIAIFSPHRFGIPEYPATNGYNIHKLKDLFRSVIVLKSNFSQANFKIPLLFKGNTSFYKELPPVSDMTQKVYEQLI